MTNHRQLQSTLWTASNTLLVQEMESQHVSEEHGSQRSDKIPRPPNCFMLFRRHLRTTCPVDVVRDNPSFSKVASGVWSKLPADQKAFWKEEARKAKEEHARLYPNYRYSPQRQKKPVLPRPFRSRAWKGVEPQETNDPYATQLGSNQPGIDNQSLSQEGSTSRLASYSLPSAVQSQPAISSPAQKDRHEVISELLLAGVQGHQLQKAIEQKEHEGLATREYFRLAEGALPDPSVEIIQESDDFGSDSDAWADEDGFGTPTEQENPVSGSYQSLNLGNASGQVASNPYPPFYPISPPSYPQVSTSIRPANILVAPLSAPPSFRPFSDVRSRDSLSGGSQPAHLPISRTVRASVASRSPDQVNRPNIPSAISVPAIGFVKSDDRASSAPLPSASGHEYGSRHGQIPATGGLEGFAQPRAPQYGGQPNTRFGSLHIPHHFQERQS